MTHSNPPKEDKMTAAEKTERQFPRTTEEALRKHAVRREAFANAFADFESSDAPLGDNPERNVLLRNREKAEKQLKTAADALRRKGFTLRTDDADPVPPDPDAAPVTPEPAPEKAKPKKPSFADTLPAREKAAQKAGPNVAAILLSTNPVKLAAVEEAIAADLVEADTEPTRDAILYIGQPVFTSPGLVTGVERPPLQQMPAPRWAGKATIARIVRRVKDAAPQPDHTNATNGPDEPENPADHEYQADVAETAVNDAEGDLDRELTDAEAMEVEAEAAKTVAA
jgi:hypothetical protein